MQMVPGSYFPTGPLCKIRSINSDNETCLESSTENDKLYGKMHVTNCQAQWAQHFSFGDGTFAPHGSLHVTAPTEALPNTDKTNRNRQSICLGVLDKEGIDESEYKNEEHGNNEMDKDRYAQYVGKPLETIHCSNVASVLTWLFIPLVAPADNDK